MFIFIFVVLSSFECAIFLFSDLETKAAVAFSKSFTIRPSYFQTNVLSKFSFTNCFGYGFMLIFS